MKSPASSRARYELLQTKREPFLSRGRACAELTIPHILPPEGHEGTNTFLSPYQSVGAQGVNNLASKILLALLPDNEPFFRFKADALDMEEAGLSIAEGEVALAAMEEAVMDEIENKAIRVPVFEAIKQLLVSGNCLVFKTKKEGLKVFRLDRYVVCRDPMGNPVEIIIKETIDKVLLPEEIQSQIEEPLTVIDQGNDSGVREDVDIFTRIKRTSRGSWKLTQEVKGVNIPSSESTFPTDKCPYLPLRLTSVDGEDYGRSYTEEYYGDLKSLEDLSKALVQGSLAASRVLFLVKPNGTTRPRTLEELPNGGIGQGNAEDVSVIQMEKQNDFGVARQTMDDITKRLGAAYLMGSTIQRKGERVTSTEIQYLANELEQVLGGIYSLLAVTLQSPLVNLVLHQLQRERKLPNVPKELVKTQVVTGMSALGRNTDYQRLKSFREEIAAAAPLIQNGSQFLNFNEFILRVATSLGIEPQDLVKTEEKTAQEGTQAQNAATAQDVMKSTAPGVIQQATKGMFPDQPQG